jgi:8-amino-7-oxononanoate synthase
MADLFGRLAPIAEGRELLRRAGVDPFGVCMEETPSATEAVIDGRRTILVGTNNYLGLSFDPGSIAAAREALERQGTGSTGSRVANGTYGGHRAVERTLARLYDRAAALLFTTGYQANLGVLSVLAGPRDTVLIDADSHASIHDGCRLSGATIMRFRHNDPEDLDRRLRRLDRGGSGNVLVVVEGIYSMLGDQAPIAELVEVKRRHDAALIVDEAHSFGVCGAKGRGVAEESGRGREVDLIVGTFSKSVGTIGGFCVSDDPRLELLRWASRPYMFTASLPPAVAAAAQTALERIEAGDGLRARLWRNIHRLHGGLARLGFSIVAPPGPVIAVRVEGLERLLALWGGLLRAGVYVNLALPPATPAGVHLLRCSVSAAHTEEQLDQVCAAFAAVARALGEGEPTGGAGRQAGASAFS